MDIRKEVARLATKYCKGICRRTAVSNCPMYDLFNWKQGDCPFEDNPVPCYVKFRVLRRSWEHVFRGDSSLYNAFREEYYKH